MRGWDEAASKMEEWTMVCTVFLWDVIWNPPTFKVVNLIEETGDIIPRLRSQSRLHPTLPASPLHLIQTEFTESFRQALEMRQQVRWPDFEHPPRSLATGILRPETNAFTRGADARRTTTAHIPAPNAGATGSTTTAGGKKSG